MNNLNIVALIPARGGSKGIPKKNLKKTAGLPLVAWTIKQAKASKLISYIFVSTDNNEIAKVSLRYGASVVKRPKNLASDIATSEDVLSHAINYIERQRKIKIDLVVFLQATSPVREKGDIDKAIKRFLMEKADSLFSAAKLEDFFIWEKRPGNYHSVNYDYRHRKRRQDIKTQYLENGSIYIFKPELIKKEHNRLGGKIAVFEMANWKSFQVDDSEGLKLCEYYIKNRLLKGRK